MARLKKVRIIFKTKKRDIEFTILHDMPKKWGSNVENAALVFGTRIKKITNTIPDDFCNYICSKGFFACTLETYEKFKKLKPGDL